MSTEKLITPFEAASAGSERKGVLEKIETKGGLEKMSLEKMSAPLAGIKPGH